MKKKTNRGLKIICLNRKASFNYFFIELIEAGIVLKGSEIKSIREGRANITEGYAREESSEIWLFNAHISGYSHDPVRPRKLLLHKSEIAWLKRQTSEKGLTIVPLKLYIKKHFAKVQIGLARGRRRHDKRRAIIDKERSREARRAMER